MTANATKILIIDDDRLIRRIIADNLDCPEYHIYESAGGKDVIEEIEALRPDLLILDIVMPEIDGFEICSELRKTAWGAELPIAILTILSDARSIKTAFQVGATDVFSKPVNLDLLGHRVKLLLQKAPPPPSKPAAPEDLLDEITDPLVVYRNDLTVEWANEQAERFYGRPAGELIGKSCQEICPTNGSGRCSSCSIKKAVLENTLRSGVKRHPDGTFWGVRAYPIKNRDGSCRKIIEIAHDITEKIKLQGDSVHARNLATVGGLASEVAHEINHRIGGVINDSQMLANRLTDDDELNPLAQRINRDGERIATIIASLLDFSAKGNGNQCQISARALVEETTPLIENSLILDQIELITNLTAGDLVVKVQKQELQQVFINLYNNARDALNSKYPEPNKRKQIVVTISDESIDQERYLVIEFFDYGAGIPEANLSKVREPFFSTKLGEGATGIGLSFCHKIMKKHRGDLLINSLEGEYTRVKLLLPVDQH